MDCSGEIKSVVEGDEYFDIRYGDCYGFGLSKKHGAAPKVGDHIELRCVRGSFVAGVKINGEVIFDKSDDEMEAERLAQVAEFKRKQLEEFERNKEKLDAKYDALPDFFKRRIDKFRANNPDFRWEFESYELFCCQQAVVIAEAHKDDPESLKSFRDLTWEQQKEKVPGLEDGHSGNTFGAAVQLAYLYLTSPETVVRLHGALAPLVGSKEYGCVPRGESE